MHLILGDTESMFALVAAHPFITSGALLAIAIRSKVGFWTALGAIAIAWAVA
jgi:hypothetical protein